MLKISIINPTYPYVYECIAKIVFYSSEDGNKNLTTTNFMSKNQEFCCWKGLTHEVYLFQGSTFCGMLMALLVSLLLRKLHTKILLYFI
jgi:hypothetical protein